MDQYRNRILSESDMHRKGSDDYDEEIKSQPLPIPPAPNHNKNNDLYIKTDIAMREDMDNDDANSTPSEGGHGGRVHKETIGGDEDHSVNTPTNSINADLPETPHDSNDELHDQPGLGDMSPVDDSHERYMQMEILFCQDLS